MNTLRYLIFKRIAKRSPRNTREAVVSSFKHVDVRTLEHEIDQMIKEHMIVFVMEGKKNLMRISTDARQLFPVEIARIQKELDREK